MKFSKALTVGLVTGFACVGVAGVSGAKEVAAASSSLSGGVIAARDFGRLSDDGVSAFNDVHQARRAIFDGKTGEAAKFIMDAQASIAKAKIDDTVFMKAEGNMRVPHMGTAKQLAARDPSNKPMSWIPIDSEIEMGETFVATPDSDSAAVTARKSLEKGDGAASLEAIKTNGLDINYVVALAPVEQSSADINQAASLIGSHDYYGASQALRHAEAGVRYDEFDDVGGVKAAPAKK